MCVTHPHFSGPCVGTVPIFLESLVVGTTEVKYRYSLDNEVLPSTVGDFLSSKHRFGSEWT